MEIKGMIIFIWNYIFKYTMKLVFDSQVIPHYYLLKIKIALISLNMRRLFVISSNWIVGENIISRQFDRRYNVVLKYSRKDIAHGMMSERWNKEIEKKISIYYGDKTLLKIEEGLKRNRGVGE